MTNDTVVNIVRDNNRTYARVAAVTAIHLVRQVLDEAYVIVNAARELDQPPRYLTMIKVLEHSSKHGCNKKTVEPKDVDESIKENCALKMVATSTPQKCTDKNVKHGNDVVSDLLGQGDTPDKVEHESDQNSTSPSMLINKIFDMSDVLFENETYDTVHGENNSQLIAKIIMTYVDEALNIAFKDELQTHSNIKGSLANNAKIENKVDDVIDISKVLLKEESKVIDSNVTNRENIAIIDCPQLSFCENPFLTLNRDDEHDRDSEPGIEPFEPQMISFDEIQLMTAHSSQENLTSKTYKDEQVKEELRCTTKSCKKGTAIRRCRIQGAKFMACLRGWWRRYTTNKRQIYRLNTGNSMCPLSPSTRQRTVSLLDQRQIESTPKQDNLWKFNTVNECEFVALEGLRL